MTEENPPLPPADSAPTPSGGMRRPMPSGLVLEQAKKMSHSEMRRMSPDEQRIVMHERTKNLESGVADLTGYTQELRQQVGGVISRVDTLASQQIDMTRQLADHAAKIEWMLKRMGAGGGVLGFLWVVFKLAELLTR